MSWKIYLEQVRDMRTLEERALTVSDMELLEYDEHFCSHGDTVHYDRVPKIFRDCQGSFMYDTDGVEYLDLQMMFASCNLGYKNKRIRDAVVDQIDTLPQISPRFLYDYKGMLSKKIVEANLKRFNVKGRVQYNVGGSQANEDATYQKLYKKTKNVCILWCLPWTYNGFCLYDSRI